MALVFVCADVGTWRQNFISSPPLPSILSVQHEVWGATVLRLSVRTSGNTCALWCMEHSVVVAGRGEVRRVALQCLRPHPFSAAGYSPRRSLAWAPGGMSRRICAPGKNRAARAICGIMLVCLTATFRSICSFLAAECRLLPGQGFGGPTAAFSPPHQPLATSCSSASPSHWEGGLWSSPGPLVAMGRHVP